MELAGHGSGPATEEADNGLAKIGPGIWMVRPEAELSRAMAS
jgi:hypothetical protein